MTLVLNPHYSMDSYALIQAKKFMGVSTKEYDVRQDILSVKLVDTDKIQLKYSYLKEANNIIPNGVIAFIGKNGSGKSTLIYNLTKLIYASPDQRFRLQKDIGVILPNDIGFNKLFLISYSPFDNFVIPGIGGDDYRLILNGVETHRSRLIFCGIRDIKKKSWKNLLAEPKEETYGELYKSIRLTETHLKPINKLAEECAKAMTDIKANSSKLEIWNEIKKIWKFYIFGY